MVQLYRNPRANPPLKPQPTALHDVIENPTPNQKPGTLFNPFIYEQCEHKPRLPPPAPRGAGGGEAKSGNRMGLGVGWIYPDSGSDSPLPAHGQGGQAEEKEKTSHIGHGGYQNARSKRRINAQRFEGVGHKHTG